MIGESGWMRPIRLFKSDLVSFQSPYVKIYVTNCQMAGIMEDQWIIATHDPEWKNLFMDVASKLKNTLGDPAIRIDHVGSTSVFGLDAKPIIDIQISLLHYDDVFKL